MSERLGEVFRRHLDPCPACRKVGRKYEPGPGVFQVPGTCSEGCSMTMLIWAMAAYRREREHP